MEGNSILHLQEKMRLGELTARQLVEYYLARIQQLDQRGPALNSIIEVNPDALSIASALDEERQQTEPRSHLHGIPILVKDNIDTADRMVTASGSMALQGNIALNDAFLISRLRQSGAIILGKANLSEWANFRSKRSSSGWSSRGGQTRNAYVLDRNPCGSSSGSAVAVAADLCTAAVGTETDGSIICPSQSNSIVGIKPTVGLVSRTGIIPISHSQDTAGPMARSVTDAAILLGAMTGVDPLDPATESSIGKTVSDYTLFLDAAALKGARLGVARNYFGFDPRVDRIMVHCLTILRERGAILIDPANIETDGKFSDTEIEVLLYEFKEDLNRHLSALPSGAKVHSMKDVIDFNETHRSQVMPYFDQDRMLKAQEKGPLTIDGIVDPVYMKALETNRRLSRAEGIDSTLQKHQLDAILAPSGGPAWLTDLINGDHYSGGDTTSVAAVAGYPHITVPAGYVFGLPIGISFISSAYQEPRLIQLAFAFEQASNIRRPPRFLPTANLEIPEI